MFEAYAIGVTLKLNNLVSPQLALMSDQFLKLEKIAISLGSTFAKIGNGKALEKIALAGNATAKALDKSEAAAARLERRMAALRLAGGGVPLLPGGVSGSGNGSGGGSGSGGGGGSGRGGHRGGYHGGNIHMGPGGVGIGTVGIAAGDAFVPLAVAGAMAWGGHALYESAKDLNTEMTKFKLFGLSNAQNSEAFSFVKGMRVYGTTQAENMRNFREAQGVFRESGLNDSEALAGAKIAAPVLSKLNFLAASLDEESAAKMKTANMAMLRYVELSGGLNNANQFNKIADFGYRMNASSGGTVDWNQLLAFKKTAGSAGYHVTDDALARLEPIMAELSGGRTGTAMATAFNRVSGITRVPNQVAHMLVDNGIWDKSKVVFNGHGGIKTMKGNPLGEKNTQLMLENPELFYESVIRPIYTKMSLSSSEVTRVNAEIFGRTGGQFYNAMERSMPVIQAAVSALEKVKGITDSVNEAKNSLSGQEQEFASAWTDFKTQFGTKILPFFSGLLKFGADVLRDPEPGKEAPKFSELSAGQIARKVLGFAFGPALPDFGGSPKKINSVATPHQNGTGLPPVIQLVPTQGGRPLAEWTAGKLAKQQFGQLGSGAFDFGVAAPNMNTRTR